MEQPTILLLEDDRAIAGTVAFALQREGLVVQHVLLVQEADRFVRRTPPAAAGLDIGLPDGSGLELCRRWRAAPEPALATLPVLMLTAHDEEIDRVLGLEAGADDYLGKPFSPRELVARVRALLRRAGLPRVTPQRLQLDEAGQRVLHAGQALPLTRLEYGLLRELLLAQGRILPRDALFDRVWGAGAEAADRTVDTHVKTLRAKLREAGVPGDPIATHRGLGYAWVADNGGR